MDGPLGKGLYAVLILSQSFLLKGKVFDKKDFDCSINPSYPIFFC